MRGLSLLFILFFYRIAQNTINDSVKHTGANSVEVAFGQEKKLLEIKISDDGVGLKKGHLKNNGLKNMQHRAKKLKAKMNINGKPGKGTVISLKIPLKHHKKKPKNTAIAV